MASDNMVDTILSGEDFSIVEGFEMMTEMNASIMKLVLREEDDTPVRGVIFLSGAQTTTQILDAIEIIEASWAADDLRVEES